MAFTVKASRDHSLSKIRPKLLVKLLVDDSSAASERACIEREERITFAPSLSKNSTKIMSCCYTISRAFEVLILRTKQNLPRMFVNFGHRLTMYILSFREKQRTEVAPKRTCQSAFQICIHLSNCTGTIQTAKFSAKVQLCSSFHFQSF